MMGRTIDSEGAWSTVTEQTEDVSVEILASAVSGRGLDAEAGARQVTPPAQVQAPVPPRRVIVEVSTVQPHTASKFMQFWISDVVDMLVDDVVDEMTRPPVEPVSLMPPAVAELMDEVVTASVERAVRQASIEDDPTPPGSPQTASECSSRPTSECSSRPTSESSSRPTSAEVDLELKLEADALSAERLEALRQRAGEPPAIPAHPGDDLLPPLTLDEIDEIDLDASDERRENAKMIEGMLLEMADGVERIMEKTRDFLSGTSDGWGTDWHNAKGRSGEHEFGKHVRQDSQWHGVGDNVFDDTVGMAPMVTVRQVREHRINSIG